MAALRAVLGIAAASLALLVTVAGIALGAEGALEGLDGVVLQPSDAPALLAPISEAGRNGWNCVPEHAAVASVAKNAELPTSEH
jgi:hypothetical protein